MAALNPKLEVKLDMDPAGFKKGSSTARKELGMINKEVGSSESKISGFKKTLASMWRITGGILLFNMIRKITHAIRDLVHTAIDFEAQMRNVNSVAQLSEKDFKALTDEVINLALDPRIKDGPSELAAGLYTITSAGYSAKDALVVLEQAALASTAGMTTTAVASDVLISTLGAYNLGVEKAGFVTNQLFQIVNISKYTFEDLASSLATVTPVASKLGIGLDEVGAAMATYAKQGVDADTATVQLNAVLTGLLKPTDALQAAIEAAGYSSGEAMIQAKGLGGTLDWLNTIIGGSAEKSAEYFGDVRALRGIIQLTTADGQVYADALVQMGYAQDGAGATAKALAEQMKSSAFQIDVLHKNIGILAVLGFGLLAPYLSKALVAINTILAGLIKSFRHFREKGYSVFEALRASFKKVFTDMFGPEAGKKAAHFIDTLESIFVVLKSIAETVLPIFMKALGFIVNHLDILVPGILGAVIALKSFALIMGIVNIVLAITEAELAPLTIAMLAIAAVGAIVAIAWTNNWFGIQEKTATAIKFIGKWLGKLWDFVQPAIHVIKLLGEYFHDVATKKIQPGNLAKLPGWLRPIALIFGRIIKTVRVMIIAWEKFGAIGAFKTIPVQIRAFGRAVRGLFDAMGLHHLADAFKETFYDIARLVTHVIDLVDDVVHGRWKQVWTDLKNIAVDLFWLFIDRFKLAGALLLDIFDMIPWGKIGSALWKGFKWAIVFLVTYGYLWLPKQGIALLSSLLTAFIGYWDSDIKPWFKAFPGNIADIIADGYDLFYNAGRDFISWIWTGIGSLWSWLAGQLSKLPGALESALSWSGWMFFNYGRDIISSIWRGVVSLWDWLMGNLANLPIAIWNKLADVPHHSPMEHAAAEIGQMAMKGMERGIQSGKKSLLKAAADVRDDLFGAMQGGGLRGWSAASFSTPNQSALAPRANTPRLSPMLSLAKSSRGSMRNLTFGPGSIIVHGAQGQNEEVLAEKVAKRIILASDDFRAGQS